MGTITFLNVAEREETAIFRAVAMASTIYEILDGSLRASRTHTSGIF